MAGDGLHYMPATNRNTTLKNGLRRDETGQSVVQE